MRPLVEKDALARTAAEMLEHLGLPGAGRCAAALAAYAEAICRANERTNLTGAKTPEAFVRGPLFDSLTLLPVLADDAPLVDVGSGGGLPGIPAAIWRRELRVALVEPRPLRTAFLRRCATELGLGVDIIEGKDSGIADGAYGAAVSQAVWPAPAWLDRAVRIVRPGGAIYALASSPVAKEAIPAGCAADALFETARPLDGAPRFAVRIRRYS